MLQDGLNGCCYWMYTMHTVPDKSTEQWVPIKEINPSQTPLKIQVHLLFGMHFLFKLMEFSLADVFHQCTR